MKPRRPLQPEQDKQNTNFGRREMPRKVMINWPPLGR